MFRPSKIFRCLAFSALAAVAPIASPAKAATIQIQVTNLTLSGGDPTFPVTDDVTFNNLQLVASFSGAPNEVLPLFDAFNNPSTTLSTSVISLDSAPIDPANLTGVTLTGDINLLTVNISTSFGAPPTAVSVDPAFTATLSSFNDGDWVNLLVTDKNGATYGIGSLSAFNAQAFLAPEPDSLGLVAIAGLSLLAMYAVRQIRRKSQTFAVNPMTANANRAALAVVVSWVIAVMPVVPASATVPVPPAFIDQTNWGLVTAPVYNSAETNANYPGAELFAGPNKFGTYFSGVLPNGRIVKPAGSLAQVGMNPLGLALTPDGKFLITSNDDERNGGVASLQSTTNVGGYTLSVVNTSTMKVVATYAHGTFFIGLQVTANPDGTYTVWASTGPSNSVSLLTLSSDGTSIAPAVTPSISIAPLKPGNAGFVNNYTPAAPLTTSTSTPSSFGAAGAKITFPAGSALSADGKFLYVACNGDNSIAVIDTAAKTVVKQVAVGYFPYTVALNATGSKLAVSNWGVTEYKFANPTYNGNGNLTAIGTTGQNQPAGFFVPPTSTTGSDPKTSSVSLVSLASGAASASLLGSIYEGQPSGLDDRWVVGETHPSAMATVNRRGTEVLFVTKSNSDSLGMILLNNNRKLPDFPLSPIHANLIDGHKVHGAYPNAIVASPDGSRIYVAEAGLNSIAVIDTSVPTVPQLLGRIGTGWYPTSLALSKDGRFLYVSSAKGIGEDINPNTANNPTATGIQSFSDSNFMFGTVQQIDLPATSVDNTTVLSDNYEVQSTADTSVVPIGSNPSAKIKHVIFILQENKTFDSMLGNLSNRFGNYASLNFNNADGTLNANQVQYTGVSLNTQALATKFAAAVNYYSDSEESDAGHQFAASGTSSDYTQKTLLVKSGRGLLVNKNFEPEDYPEGGYIFNNAARHNVSFKDYGAMIRIEGTDTGTSKPTTINDPNSGLLGYPTLNGSNIVVPVTNAGDTTSPVSGLGQSYFLNLPILSILGAWNASGEPHLDKNYPGYNFNISDQRRAAEFNSDFDRMVTAGTLPTFIYLYLPNDHTGGVQAPNAATVGSSAKQQVADGDVALGTVLNHIMRSPIYYDGASGTGAAIFATFDDAQATLDHIHQHRTPLTVISPFAKPAYTALRHYSTASVVKTEELLLGLPPNNFGDLTATDLRDLFQSSYNGVTAEMVGFNLAPPPLKTSMPGRKIWQLVNNLDTSAPDRDSHRLGELARLSVAADDLYFEARKQHKLSDRAYRQKQRQLLQRALQVVNAPAPRDSDS